MVQQRSSSRADDSKGPTSSDGRVPPYSNEAEMAVLGGILLNNESLHIIQDVLKAEDFYNEVHRRIYVAIEALSSAGQPVDHVTLGQELQKKGDLEKIGGAMALAGLTDSVATVANIEHYAQIVRQKAAVRRMIYAAQEVVARGYGDYGEAVDYLDSSEESIFRASQQHLGSAYVHVSHVLKKAFKDFEIAAGRKGDVTGIPSGFAMLDKKTSGFQRSDFIIIAGRPSMGKTALALNIAAHAAISTKRPVLFFSLEMSKDQIVRRLLASEGRIDAAKVRSSKLDKDDWQKVIQVANTLMQAEIYLDDSAPLTPIEIRAKSRRLKAEKNLGLVVIDYLQLMRTGGRRPDSREQEISEISRSLKGLAKELEVPVIALSQLNRGVESRPDKRPIMADLRESGAIEQDADLIVFVYRDEVYNKDSGKKGIAELIISKQRSGPIGTVEVRFFKDYTRFENLTREEESQGYGSDDY